MRSWILLFIGIIAFSLLGSFRKMADGWPSVLLAFIRLAGAALILKLFVYRGKLKPIKSTKSWIEFALIGILMALGFSLYMEAFDYTNISDIKVIGFIDPILVLIFAGVLLKEKVSKYSFVAAGLAVLGLGILAAPAGLWEVKGLLMALLAMICGAGVTILIRMAEQNAPLEDVLVYPFAFGAGTLLLSMLVFGLDVSYVDWTLWPWVLGLTAMTALGYYAYDSAMKVVGAHVADLALRIGISLFGALFAIIITGETLSENWGIAAGFLVLSAAVMRMEKIFSKHPYRQRPHGHTH